MTYTLITKLCGATALAVMVSGCVVPVPVPTQTEVRTGPQVQPITPTVAPAMVRAPAPAPAVVRAPVAAPTPVVTTRAPAPVVVTPQPVVVTPQPVVVTEPVVEDPAAAARALRDARLEARRNDDDDDNGCSGWGCE